MYAKNDIKYAKLKSLIATCNYNWIWLTFQLNSMVFRVNLKIYKSLDDVILSLNHISTYAAVYETNTKTEFNNTGKKHCKFNNGGIEESYKPALKNLVQKKKHIVTNVRTC